MQPRFEGDEIEIAGRALLSDSGMATVSASNSGVLAYLDGSSRESDSRLAWVDRSGNTLGTEGPVGPPSPTSLSPDEGLITILRRGAGSTFGDLWTREPGRAGAESKITFGDAASQGGNIVWSPDGNHIAFPSRASGVGDLSIMDRPFSGAEPRPVVRSKNRTNVTDWFDKYLVYTEVDAKTGGTGADVWYQRLTPAAQAEGAPVRLLHANYTESFGQISPDGHWIAYLSNETTYNEIYVQRFPAGGDKQMISESAGAGQVQQPRWSRDGRTLFYVTGPAGRYTLMAVPVVLAPTFHRGAAQRLFDARINSVHPVGGTFFYSVSTDGQRFLLDRVDSPSEPVLKAIANWQQAFAKAK